MNRYKLNFTRDVDTDEPGVLILNLPAGFKFNYDAYSNEHVRAFDSRSEMKESIRDWVVPCDCNQCSKEVSSK